jgi:two-component system, OmpR family, response regulator VanR
MRGWSVLNQMPLSGSLGRGIVILIVEDEVMIRNFVQIILMAEGFEVLTAADGQEALEVLRAFPDLIHMILTDVKMPKVNGFKLAKQVQLESPETKIVFMCGDWDFPGETLPVNVILKPFQPEDLIQRVRKELSMDR